MATSQGGPGLPEARRQEGSSHKPSGTLNLRLLASSAVRDSMQPQDTCTDLFEDWGEVLPLKTIPRARSVREPGLAKPTLPRCLADLLA